MNPKTPACSRTPNPERMLATLIHRHLTDEPSRLRQAGLHLPGHPIPPRIEPWRELPTGTAMPLLFWAARLAQWWLVPNAADEMGARAARTRSGEHLAAWMAGGQMLGLRDRDICEVWTSTDARALAALDSLARHGEVRWTDLDDN